MAKNRDKIAEQRGKTPQDAAELSSSNCSPGPNGKSPDVGCKGAGENNYGAVELDWAGLRLRKKRPRKNPKKPGSQGTISSAERRTIYEPRFTFEDFEDEGQ